VCAITKFRLPKIIIDITGDFFEIAAIKRQIFVLMVNHDIENSGSWMNVAWQLVFALLVLAFLGFFCCTTVLLADMKSILFLVQLKQQQQSDCCVGLQKLSNNV